MRSSAGNGEYDIVSTKTSPRPVSSRTHTRRGGHRKAVRHSTAGPPRFTEGKPWSEARHIPTPGTLIGFAEGIIDVERSFPKTVRYSELWIRTWCSLLLLKKVCST